jgi:hypothetical protein
LCNAALKKNPSQEPETKTILNRASRQSRARLIKGDICPYIFSAIPWKLHIFFILERMFDDG